MQEFLIIKLANFLGLVALGFCGFAIMNYIVKFLNKNYAQKLNQISILKKNMPFLTKFFVKNHRYFGFIAITALIFHFLLQIKFNYLSYTGLIAAIILIMQGLLGIYGLNKKREGIWFKLHKLIAILMVIAIGIHVLTKI